MAARRLLIIMLILLGISTLAAALVPTRSPNEGDSESTAAETTEAEIPDPLPAGDGLVAKIEVGGKKTPVVPMKLGDQLSLTVRSRRSDLLEIPALGLVEPISPGTPVLFNILPENEGSYGIRMVEADRVVARIEVEKPKKDEDGKRSSGKGEKSER